jgi:hypothetical protein
LGVSILDSGSHPTFGFFKIKPSKSKIIGTKQGLNGVAVVGCVQGQGLNLVFAPKKIPLAVLAGLGCRVTSPGYSALRQPACYSGRRPKFTLALVGMN